MTTLQFDEATRHQITAADPRASTWLSANAGSGKTRVLTDRVARLLLDDVPPQNILCLTYTKAAASEMQNRLFRRLGEWSMREDDELREALAQLGVARALDADTLARARRLFARAIETPGGLKIQTIHSFCAGLLRRFPLEAGVSPGFTELDEDATARLQTEVLDTVALRAPEAFAEMAALIGDADLTGLASEISAHRTLFPASPSRDTVLALYDLPPGFDEKTAVGHILSVGEDELCDLASALSKQTATTKKVAQALNAALEHGFDQTAFSAIADLLLRKADGLPKTNVLSDKRREELGYLAQIFDDLCRVTLEAFDQLKSLEAARRTLALHRFAAAFLPEYARRKEEGGWLDFDDQIERAERLLAQPGIAEWVLYKLDGGIDHVLVDEAQDTSPLQWRVIEHLTREFTSGAGRSDVGERSIFVVGDLKQSIYSFQGADPAGFIRMRQTFAERLEAIDLRLQQLELKYSFRSSGEILGAVDCTFGEGDLRGMGDTVNHIAFKGQMPGRVDLWPLVEPSEKPETGDWFDPVDRRSDEHHTMRLARQVAGQIREMVDTGFLWEERDGGFIERPIGAGDVLVLVQSRGPLFHEIIRACKTAGLEVAGADVLKLGEELAVRDIRATLSFLATPEDDLSLAAALRSPLFGWTEADLYDLAAGRAQGEFLWRALRNRAEQFPDTVAMLWDLLGQLDYLRPYDLIERLLIRHDGRRRLVARLGEEASDGIDSLLAQALDLEQSGPLSLTGFLARMEGAEVKVKRRAEGRSSKVRVMTVHGAKGLESPIVILPDTGNRRTPRMYKGRLLSGPEGVPLWSMSQGEGPGALSELKQAAVTRQLEESQRLLYVAMTRAEQWLIVAAAGDLGKAGDSWYEQVQTGLEARGAVALDFAEGPGLRLESPHWSAGKRPAAEAQATAAAPSLPEWLDQPAEAADRPPATLSPSDLGGAKVLPGEPGAQAGGLDTEAAMERGTRIHLLLEHLAPCPPADRPRRAAALLGPEVSAPEQAELLREALRILEEPDLEFLFAPGTLAEVPLSASLPELGGRRIHGTIDRLVIGAGHVLAVDFKTNALVPDAAEQTPLGLLRQMGCYASGLKQVFPDHEIRTAILWTRSARLVHLPAALVHEAVSGVPLP
ncbi:double-strand break repair helicase AddA [Tropicimonas sediminicola]|uniref:DNA 3'-5' helicase n=1 Tax=Tropicimonas sediminicola TaxID=1031541 RepID=A0A239KXN4_9RHOB|nr:double-strand break repair helicase AddA [Tropicimonas sediminicola]SNT22815.1 DNA helicase/exodeoxyribonuclease V, subunit A [Tropicimonas sediminicola]